MDEATIEQTVEELIHLPIEIAEHRAAISEIAARRRELAQQLSDEIGPTKAAKRLGISRQVFWQILNPGRAQDIKRRSGRAKTAPIKPAEELRATIKQVQERLAASTDEIPDFSNIVEFAPINDESFSSSPVVSHVD